MFSSTKSQGEFVFEFKEFFTGTPNLTNRLFKNVRNLVLHTKKTVCRIDVQVMFS